MTNDKEEIVPHTMTDANFQVTVMNERPTLVEFSAPGCGACEAQHSILMHLVRERANDVGFSIVDIGEQMDLAERLGILQLPTLMLFRRGEVVARLDGAQSRKKLSSALDRLATHGA